jgi:rod shape-determining protein MreD
MTEGTRWQFVGFIAVLVVLYFLLRVGLGLGALAPDLLVVALLLASRRMRAGQAAGLGFLLGVLDGAAHPLTMGAGAVALSILGFLGARSREGLSGDSPVLLALYLFAGKWLYDAIVYVLLIRPNLAGPVSTLLLASPLAAVYAAAVGLAAAMAYKSVV